MASFRKDFLISIPEITVTVALPITLRKIIEKLLAGLCTPISQGHRPRLMTEGSPEPNLMLLATYKTPQLIEFQDVIRLSCIHTVLKAP